MAKILHVFPHENLKGTSARSVKTTGPYTPRPLSSLVRSQVPREPPATSGLSVQVLVAQGLLSQDASPSQPGPWGGCECGAPPGQPLGAPAPRMAVPPQAGAPRRRQDSGRGRRDLTPAHFPGCPPRQAPTSGPEPRAADWCPAASEALRPTRVSRDRVPASLWNVEARGRQWCPRRQARSPGKEGHSPDPPNLLNLKLNVNGSREKNRLIDTKCKAGSVKY